MIKTKLICSYDYAKLLNPRLSEADWEEIVDAGRRFEPSYKEKTPVILDKIRSYTGFDWSSLDSDTLPIYVAKFDGPSRTKPVTIKIGENQDMLLKMVHELVHVNVPYRSSVFSREIYEDIVNQVTAKVAQDVGIGGPSDKILAYRHKLIEEGITVLDIPLDRMTLKEYVVQRGDVHQAPHKLLW